jgi:hypothetical protein
VDEAWNTFKNSLSEVLVTVCGTKKARKTKGKATPWWNEETKEAVK